MSLLNQQIRVCKEGNYDELYTPRDFVEVLLKYIPKHVKTIWCSCDTEKSEYVKVFKENGYNVIATSLTEGIDFLTESRECDMIITNPPFSIKDKILERCYALGKPFALLLSEKAVGGQRRVSMFRANGMGLICLGRRADFTGKGSAWFNVHYFIHGEEFDGRIFFEPMPKIS